MCGSPYTFSTLPLSNFSTPKILTLDKISTETVKKFHPWIFKNRIEDRCKSFSTGDILTLKENSGRTLGFGVYSERDELIRIRVLHFGEVFTPELVKEKIKTAISKRLPLLIYTNSFRILHGENDSFPGLTIDYHGGTLILRYYSDSLYSYGRMVMRMLWSLVKEHSDWGLELENAYIQTPIRTGKAVGHTKKNFIVLRGVRKDYIKINYRDIEYHISPSSQKGGIYNDIRNLRDYLWLHKKIVKNSYILNLFSNNGLLSKILIELGARKVISIEDSKDCIEVHRHNLEKNSVDEIIKMNLFSEYEGYANQLQYSFNLIIVDPPSLTSSAKDKPQAIKIYKKLIKISLKILQNEGYLILCSCSNRIHSNEFESIAKATFQEENFRMKRIDRLPPELDHPVLETFPEGNYFKVHIYKKI